jgi:hypothetical protein
VIYGAGIPIHRKSCATSALAHALFVNARFSVIMACYCPDSSRIFHKKSQLLAGPVALGAQ